MAVAAHGPDVFVEEVNDWRPFDYLTLTTLPPMPGAAKVVMTYAFVETDAGTHVEIRVAKPKPKEEGFFTQFGPILLKILEDELAALKAMLEGDKGPPAVVEEPSLPASAQRFVTQPVRAR